MSTIGMEKLGRRLRSLVPSSEKSDHELLAEFLSERRPEPFESLVRRHGPMVMGVCHRVLQNPHDAEDAFQATFIVLVRRASSLRQRDLLANWLYGVALRTALEARGKGFRRRQREQQVQTMPEPVQKPASAAEADLPSLLDAELSKIDDKFREPIVLCDLQSKSRREAADLLRINEGTLSSRLATGRRKLAVALKKRGVTLAVGGVSATLAHASAVAGSVATSSALGTAKAAVHVLSEAGASNAISSTVWQLSERVVKTMVLKKLMKTSAIVAVLGVAALSLGFILRPFGVSEGGGPSFAGVASAQGGGKETPSPSIIGTWKVAYLKERGRDDKLPSDFYFEFTKDAVSFFADGKQLEGAKYVADGSNSPGNIEISIRSKGPALLGIFRLMDENLELCMAGDAGVGEAGQRPRPTEFSSTAENAQMHAKLVRVAQIPPAAKAQRQTVADAQAAVARQQTINNLRQIGLAMHNYHDAHGSFPPAAGVPAGKKHKVSWRVLILPYLNQAALFQQYKQDEPWDSEHNKKIAETIVPLFGGGKDGKTKFRTFVGKDTAFPPGDKGMRLAGITDGTSNTILVAEGKEGVEWTKPEDWEYDAQKKLPVFDEKGFLVLLGDGSVHQVPGRFNENVFRLLITRNDGMPVDFGNLKKN